MCESSLKKKKEAADSVSCKKLLSYWATHGLKHLHIVIHWANKFYEGILLGALHYTVNGSIYHQCDLMLWLWGVCSRKKTAHDGERIRWTISGNSPESHQADLNRCIHPWEPLKKARQKKMSERHKSGRESESGLMHSGLLVSLICDHKKELGS